MRHGMRYAGAKPNLARRWKSSQIGNNHIGCLSVMPVCTTFDWTRLTSKFRREKAIVSPWPRLHDQHFRVFCSKSGFPSSIIQEIKNALSEWKSGQCNRPFYILDVHCCAILARNLLLRCKKNLVIFAPGHHWMTSVSQTHFLPPSRFLSIDPALTVFRGEYLCKVSVAIGFVSHGV